MKKKPNPQRKVIQAYVDKHVIKGINDHDEHAAIKKYIKTDFGLMGNRYAHNLKF